MQEKLQYRRVYGFHRIQVCKKKHLNTINSQGILKVRSVTSDASAQIMKSVHDYKEESNIPTKHYKCFIHKLRSFKKNFRGIKLTSSLIGWNKDIFMRTLSSNSRSRLRVELIRIKKTTTENSFFYRASNAVQNIISFFANDCVKRFTCVQCAFANIFN